MFLRPPNGRTRGRSPNQQREAGGRPIGKLARESHFHVRTVGVLEAHWNEKRVRLLKHGLKKLRRSNRRPQGKVVALQSQRAKAFHRGGAEYQEFATDLP